MGQRGHEFEREKREVPGRVWREERKNNVLTLSQQTNFKIIFKRETSLRGWG